MPLNNLGQVCTGLWRSAQPDAQGGLDLRHFVERIYRLNCINTTWPEEDSWGDVRPREIEVWDINLNLCLSIAAEIYDAVMGGYRVLVHCHQGRDRTGLIVGIIRLRYFGWTLEQVEAERRVYGATWLIDVTFDARIQAALKAVAESMGQAA